MTSLSTGCHEQTATSIDASSVWCVCIANRARVELLDTRSTHAPKHDYSAATVASLVTPAQRGYICNITLSAVVQHQSMRHASYTSVDAVAVCLQTQLIAERQCW
jgi:hypothetical protein